MAFQHQTCVQHSYHGQYKSPMTSDSGNSSYVLPEYPLSQNTPPLPLYESNGDGGHCDHPEPTIRGSGLEYQFFLKAYQLIERRCAEDYKRVRYRFDEEVFSAVGDGIAIWTSYLFNPGKRCKYTFALREVTFLVATLDLIKEEDRPAVRDITWLALGIVNCPSSSEPTSKHQRYTLGKWKYVGDTLEFTYTKQFVDCLEAP